MFDDDVRLTEEGIIDSRGLVELVTFIENTYGIEVHDRELDPNNLETVRRLAAFVQNKLQSSTSRGQLGEATG